MIPGLCSLRSLTRGYYLSSLRDSLPHASESTLSCVALFLFGLRTSEFVVSQTSSVRLATLAAFDLFPRCMGQSGETCSQQEDTGGFGNRRLLCAANLSGQ